MALQQCEQCGNEVSTEAQSCPHCGAVLRKKTSGCAGCLAVSILGFVVVTVIASLSETGTTSPKTQEELREERIGKHFSGWDGSHDGLTKVIKASMNDPDSYDHVETVYWDKGDHLIVRTTFGGKNAFGGVVKNSVKARVDLNGNVLQVIEQGR